MEILPIPQIMTARILCKALLGGELDVIKYLIDEQHVYPSCRDEDGNTPLHIAALCGQLAVVKYLITEKHCNPMCKGQYGRTPLNHASQNGHLDVIKYLIDEQQADPFCQDEDCNTPLHIAALHGHLAVVEYLITKKHCNPMCKGQYGRTPLHSASQYGHLDVMKYLIDEQQADPLCRDEEGDIPLHIAALHGQLAMVEYLITEKHCNPMCKGIYGRTPLHSASQNGHLDVMKYLIDEQQADPLRRDQDGDTPLHTAALWRQLAVVKYLITEKHCNPMCNGKYGRTPLHHASRNGHLGVINYLIDEQQADPLCRDQDGDAPLHIAALHGQLVVVMYLITAKHCNPMCKGMHSRTPLHCASESDNLDLIKYLIDQQLVSPSCWDGDGETPLHHAAFVGSLEVVKYLTTEKRCDPMCKDKLGITPLHLASRSQSGLDVVKYLIDEQQINPSCRDEKGNTPLHDAAGAGSLSVVKYLTIEIHCDPMCKNKLGMTPLHFASMSQSGLDVVKYLIDEQQVEPSNRDVFGSTPLHNASQKDQLEVVKYLITEKHCNPMCKDDFGSTPIDAAMRSGHLELLNFFSEAIKAQSTAIKEQSTYPTYPGQQAQTQSDFYKQKVLQAAIAASKYTADQTSSTTTPSHQEVNDVAFIEPRIPERTQPPPDSPQPPLDKPQPAVTPSPALRGPEFERPTAQEFQLLRWKNGDRKEEIRIMEEVKPHWREFGIALGFSVNDLDAIELGGLRMPSRCIQSVFGEWSRKMSTTHHWKGLIAALNKAGFPDLATRVTYAVEQPRPPSTLGELWNHQKLKPFILQNPKPTGNVLGHGAYGSVVEVEIEGTVCAGKKFRHDLFSRDEDKFCEMFTKEYTCVSQLQHKHIVQYHGICSLPDSMLPVLVMERLETNLHDYLLNSGDANLDLAVKVSILRGIAKGLVYLHNQKPAIIHRDLTARNILLDMHIVPKISDFGNSQIFVTDPSSSLKTMSKEPGTPLYMPPEACHLVARYNTKLDIFSYGHLALFVATQVFPSSLLSATYYSKIGGKRQLQARTELERRKEYFDKLGDQHPLTILAKQCLDNEPGERPKATAIETQLDALRRTQITKHTLV